MSFNLGASTACFYPMLTEEALRQVVDLEFDKTEIFMNSLSELDEPFLRQLRGIVQGSGTQIVSIHPFSSFLESSCIFGDYQRRFDDFIGIYDKTCYAAANLGARLIVIHGAVAMPKIPIPDERYFERFSKLIEIGKREGVTVCQENVNRFKSESIDFCKKMRESLGSDFKMVFDIKQSIRAHQNTFEFLEEFKNDIIHMHISDNCKEKGDCLPPGSGSFDFKKAKQILDSANYDGSYIIEIYSRDYHVADELRKSKAYLENLCQD